MDTSDWEESTEVDNNPNDMFDWAKVYLSGKFSDARNAPKEFLEKYRDSYDEAKKEAFNSPLSSFREKLKYLKDNFYEFLELDWQNIMMNLVKKWNSKIFDFILFLNEEAILPDDFENSFAFKAYQDFICSKKAMKKLSASTEVSGRLKIKTSNSENWEVIEDNNKEFYVLKIECASYVRSVNSPMEEFNTLKVSDGIVKTKGLVFKSPFPFDEIFYYEV